MSVLLDVRDLTVRFGLPKPSMFAPRPYLEAVRQVSFTLHEGRALGIVGESGSGKTTAAMAAIISSVTSLLICSPQSGMLPCFRAGRSSSLSMSISKARTRRWRV